MYWVCVDQKVAGPFVKSAACRFLKDKTSGLYDMQDVPGLR